MRECPPRGCGDRGLQAFGKFKHKIAIMVDIIPYQLSWVGDFQKTGAVLRQGLGELALRIDHIGSTAVPGLAAKDVIDVQITVAALDEPIRANLETLGYKAAEGIWRDHQPPESSCPAHEWEKLFFYSPTGQRRMNTHVRVQGYANSRYSLLFRDYLRQHAPTAAAYAELKRLLGKHLSDPDLYSDVKDPAVDLIYFAAEDWAVATGWNIGPSDA